MTTLGFYRTVIEETGQTNRERSSRASPRYSGPCATASRRMKPGRRPLSFPGSSRPYGSPGRSRAGSP